MCTHVDVLNQENYSQVIIQRRKEKEIIPMYGRILQGGKALLIVWAELKKLLTQIMFCF